MLIQYNPSCFRMKAPSFFIAEEDDEGVLMEYRSKRRGFQYYVQGQIKELSKNFAIEIKKLEIEVKKQEVSQGASVENNIRNIPL